MKHLTLTFAMFLTFTVFSFAQIQGNFQVKKINPQLNPAIKKANFVLPKPNCPDLAAVGIEYRLVRRYTRFSGQVRITGVVKNIGSQHFVSNPSQMSVILYEDIPGRGAVVRAKQSFGNIPAGRTARVSFIKKWSTSTEFPPNYRVCVVYDPDIQLDRNPRNDDCNSSNNCKRRRGSDINKLFHTS